MGRFTDCCGSEVYLRQGASVSPFDYAEGDAALTQTRLVLALVFHRESTYVAGIGISWCFAADAFLRDPFTSETFHRFQLAQFLAVTLDVRSIVDPSLNPKVAILALLGGRLGAAF